MGGIGGKESKDCDRIERINDCYIAKLLDC